MAAVSNTKIPDTIGYVASVVGSVVGSLAGGLAGIRIGMSMLDEPTRAENPLDTLFVNTFEVIFGLVVVAFVTIAFICLGVAVGVFGALRIARRPRATMTALLCLAIDGAAIPLAFVVANAVDEAFPDLSVLAALGILVLLVPLLARWAATRFSPQTTQSPL